MRIKNLMEAPKASGGLRCKELGPPQKKNFVGRGESKRAISKALKAFKALPKRSLV